MPFRIWTTPGFVSYQPSTDGITDSTPVRWHAIGCGANGGNGDFMGGGGGGGGGERRSAEHTITTATDTYNVQVAAGDSGNQTYVDLSGYIVRAVPGGSAFGQTGGSAGSGGTGAFIAYDGGGGGMGEMGGGGGGGGGGSAGRDSSAGEAGAAGGSGGGGGASGTQVGDSGRGGGGSGVTSGDGNPGTDWGGGGGGGAQYTGLGGAGRNGIVILAWGASLENYPYDFTEGYQADPGGEPASTSAWMLLLGT